MRGKKLLTLLAALLAGLSLTGAESRAQLPTPPADETGWLGSLVGGGSLSSSSANTLGNLGHFSIGVDAALARPENLGSTATASSVSAVIRLGLSEGYRLSPAVHGFGSVDGWVRFGRAQINGKEDTDAGFWGAGMRLGILRNSILTPAVSLSLAYSSLGEMPLGHVFIDAPAQTVQTDFSMVSLRLDVSKNLFIITPMAGIGVNWNSQEFEGGTIMPSAEESELVVYGGVEWNLMILRLGLEVGVTGDDAYGRLGARIAM